jgi:uncharacterized protein (DUF362 family)
MGLGEKIKQEQQSVLLKINLARPAKPNHPRTDAGLLAGVIEYVSACGGSCAIAESANHYLSKNLEQAGLEGLIQKHRVRVIDLDLEEAEQVITGGEAHYIPKCFREYGLRIGIPATSKRPEMLYSNNVKLFVGAVPRRMYQLGGQVLDWRPRVHVDLHRSVSNIFKAVQAYSPFSYFINGGLAMHESRGEFMLDGIFVGNDAAELDLHLLERYFADVEKPDYLNRLA